ncbi:discoidin domain-containing protein [Oscillatoria laete-virens NRMC-F 0139]|nr:discoidin domain-containing protein [Oscillatoria laete-virens]MDL5053758.1 discoidin domain-containing protein [Oscillatoria laete-virens NRMC-F 0139]
MKFLENERLADRIELELLERLSPSDPWSVISRLNLINRGMPYYPSLLRGLIDIDGEYELQAGCQLAVKQRDVGFGLLAVNDLITFHGTQIVGSDSLSAPIIVQVSIPEMNPTFNVNPTIPVDVSANIAVEPIAIPVNLSVECGSSEPQAPVIAAWLNKSTFIATSNMLGNNPQNGIDGNPSTFWEGTSGMVGGEWFRVDMQKTTTISQVRIRCDASIHSGAIQISTDGNNWQPVAGGTFGADAFYSFPDAACRFVRLYLTFAASQPNWRVNEIDVFGV